ncbi:MULTISPECIES: polysaccharide ABC transporter ATP-binding protein [Chryseobacterium]|uniref:ABC transporter ATP-binding protein n=1 Tax=Chryseobacterium TaxID=59732 RepID=UPI0016268BF2|nr:MULTISPECIES: polysaccharide ABC transporter ATP-binding protein [Chryseobacterium]MDM1553644.1 ATP-binding cassette domain-containing protein [Chryseobacterium indologenes]
MLALKAENISKQYRLGEVGTGTLSHDLNRFWHKIRGKEDPYLKIGEANDRTIKGESDYVWSLRDIDFEIQQGDAVGIIGRNGAGKSTLLKLLSKVTKPTTGQIYTNGRIASLLEVGTGFHPEMTGRENVFLNGAILGMTKKEIKRKFDEIVDFSGVERYIDTPVKRYSSGMYVRLAFAVAAHLESEILVVDEVLAVGDAEFQKKCLGKMGDVTKGEGRTILFVSHNMAAVKTLCNNGILLEKGMVKYSGNIDKCVSYYLGNSKENEYIKNFDIGSENVRIQKITVKNSGADDFKNLYENQAIELITEINVLTHNPERYHLTYVLNNEQGEPLFSLSHFEQFGLKPGHNKIKCTFPAKYFQSGNYYLSLYIIEDSLRADFIESDIFTFIVEDTPRELGDWMGREPGYIRPTFNWTLD